MDLALKVDYGGAQKKYWRDDMLLSIIRKSLEKGDTKLAEKANESIEIVNLRTSGYRAISSYFFKGKNTQQGLQKLDQALDWLKNLSDDKDKAFGQLSLVPAYLKADPTNFRVPLRAFIKTVDNASSLQLSGSKEATLKNTKEVSALLDYTIEIFTLISEQNYNSANLLAREITNQEISAAALLGVYLNKLK